MYLIILTNNQILATFTRDNLEYIKISYEYSSILFWEDVGEAINRADRIIF